jgi:hypothetical protein
MKRLFILAAMLAPLCMAQEAPVNIYAAGVSSDGQTIAGTGMYARLTGQSYAFALVDAVPVSARPFAVITNFGGGYAQKAVTIGRVNVFVPTAVQLSLNGAHKGWAWTSGALADVPIRKGPWRIQPNVRLTKSSVSDGETYQVIGGVFVAWGK